MNTIELYQRVPGQDGAGLELICKYNMPNARCLDMKKVTIDARKSVFEPCSQLVEKPRRAENGGNDANRSMSGIQDEEDEDYCDVRMKDILVVHLPELKFLILEFDPAVCELGTYCIFNLDHSEELKITGKRFPKQGLLRTISSESTSLSGFGFLADDSLFCWVQLQEIQEAAAATHAQSSVSRKQANQSKSIKSLELIKRQSSHIYMDDLRDLDEPVVQGVLCSIQLNEKYMNAMPGDPTKVAIEQLVKPLEFFQLDKPLEDFETIDKYDGIQFIVDMQLVESRTSQTVSLLVLYKSDIQMMVGTKARYPVTRLAIFELQGAGIDPGAVEEQKSQSQQSKYPSNAEQTQQGQPGSALLKFDKIIKALPMYANRILTTASSTDDYCFLITPYSLCLVRLERNHVTEIFTSTLGLTITEKFNEDLNKMFYPYKTQTERNLLDEYATQELKLDGTAKLISLPDHRILVLDEKGDFNMITIRFDQAEIDVAEAVFQSIGKDERLVGSGICLTPLIQTGSDFDIFVTSHFHDASLLRLRTVKDPDKIAQLEQQSAAEEVQKRQRLNSNDQTQRNFINRRRRQMTFYEDLQTLETLPTISPICDAVQIPAIAGFEPKDSSQTQYSMDFLIGSGNQVKSYLTFAAASVPLQSNTLGLAQLLPTSQLQASDLRVLRIIGYQNKYIFVNYVANGSIKTSAIDIQSKKLVQVKEDKLNICYGAETITFGEISDGCFVQVCPQLVRSLSVTSDQSQVLCQLEFQSQSKTVLNSCIDPKTKILFTLVQVDSSKRKTFIEASFSENLQPIFTQELGMIERDISAISLSTVPNQGAPNLLCVVTKATFTKPAEMLIFEVIGFNGNNVSRLHLVFKCSQVSEQLPILPNQLRGEYHDLLTRSITDLSVNISSANAAQQSAASDQRLFSTIDHIDSLTPDVQEIKLWFPESSQQRPLLILLLTDQQVILYQGCHFNEQHRFRFKLVESHILVRPRSLVQKDRGQESSLQKGSCQELIHTEGKMALILHFWKPFAIFMRQGKPVCIDIGRQQDRSIASTAFFQSALLAIDNAHNSVKIIKFPQRFDPRVASIKLCDGYLLKQFLFKDKGIKKIKLFSPCVQTANGFANPPPQDAAKANPNEEQKQAQPSPEMLRQYVFLATYEHRKPSENTGRGQADFTADARAPSIFYFLEVLRLPRADKWNEYSEEQLLRNCIKEPFQENDVINQLEQITLRSTQGDFRNYMSVASVRIDTTLKRPGNHAPRQDDEGFYSSMLNIYQVVPEQNKLKVFYVGNYKRSITCMSSYLGGLIATMKNLKLQDLVFIMYKFDEQQKTLIDEQPLPNGVINLATSISFDGDYIIIGDAYKNLHLLKKCDEQDNEKEKQQNSGLINFKKVMSNKIDANVIGAFSLNKKLALREQDQAKYCQHGVMSYEQIIPLTEIQKKMFTIIAASFDGYVRLYKINEVKNLEIKAQINIMDKVLATIPLQLNPLKAGRNNEKQQAQVSNEQDRSQHPQEEAILAGMQDRKIAMVTQRNGILIASSCGELEYRAQQSMIELISRNLPHRGCLTPMHSHLTPTTIFPEKSTEFERMNSNSINYSKTLHLFYFLSAAQKRNIAMRIGFSVERLEQFISNQRQLVGQQAPEQLPQPQQATQPVTPAASSVSQAIPDPAAKATGSIEKAATAAAEPAKE